MGEKQSSDEKFLLKEANEAISINPPSTYEVRTASEAQVHMIAGLSYNHINFPLIGEVVTKYKSFEVPKMDETSHQDINDATSIHVQTQHLHVTKPYLLLGQSCQILSLQSQKKIRYVTSSLSHRGESYVV